MSEFVVFVVIACSELHFTGVKHNHTTLHNRPIEWKKGMWPITAYNENLF